MAYSLRNRRLFGAGCIGLLIGFLPPSSAQARRGGRVRFRGGLPDGRTYAGPTLTREQLERCVMLEAEVGRSADAIDAEETSINAQQAQLERFTREVEVQSQRVDQYSQTSVSRFNGLVDRQRSMVTAFNSRVPAFNARVEGHNTRISQFNTLCGEKPYYESDMQAVRSKLGITP